MHRKHDETYLIVFIVNLVFSTFCFKLLEAPIMHLLPLLVGVTIVIVNTLIQPLIAEISTETLPAVTSLCGLKIGGTYCRSGVI